MLIKSPAELAAVAVSRRKQLGLSQSQVADKVGLQQKTISAFENKPENVMLSTTFLILSALHLDLKAISKEQHSDKTTEWKQEW